MLYSIDDTDHPITHIPHEADYRAWRARLANDAYDAIMQELNSRAEGREVETSSWIPGSAWEGTIWYPIYEACGRNPNTSGLFFGLLVWKMFMEHDADWSFGRYEKDGIPIKGLTYFRIDRRGKR